MQSIYCIMPITEFRIDCLLVICTASFFLPLLLLFVYPGQVSFALDAHQAPHGIEVS